MNTRILPVWPGINRKKCWEFKILRILKGSSFSCQQKGVVQCAGYAKDPTWGEEHVALTILMTTTIACRNLVNAGTILDLCYIHVVYIYIYIWHILIWLFIREFLPLCPNNNRRILCQYMSMTNGWAHQKIPIPQVISFNSVLSALHHSWPRSLALLLQMRVLWAA